ncbi:hypothetical protein JZ751_013102 [Albula glossodonta]|uniref:Uncharacterized protein n=1 Tax=Albula glossodonta TaxID=121402 RepID=A0A8T2NU97_9TELE|nr:hypothetical protein JZ751_013102 [Albula glossodonta]
MEAGVGRPCAFIKPCLRSFIYAQTRGSCFRPTTPALLRLTLSPMLRFSSPRNEILTLLRDDLYNDLMESREMRMFAVIIFDCRRGSAAGCPVARQLVDCESEAVSTGTGLTLRRSDCVKAMGGALRSPTGTKARRQRAAPLAVIHTCQRGADRSQKRSQQEALWTRPNCKSDYRSM